MAYDPVLADRIRVLVGDESGLSERKMFGGLAFLVDGHMAVAASGQGGVIVRVDPAQAAAILAASAPTTVRPMEMRGRPMAGWLRVEPAGLRTQKQLARWVGLGVTYTRSLPAKDSSG